MFWYSAAGEGAAILSYTVNVVDNSGPQLQKLVVVGVGVGDLVLVGVGVLVAVGVSVLVGVTVGVLVGVGVLVAVIVFVGVGDGVI
jgi:uncharacterized OB-fold protein